MGFSDFINYFKSSFKIDIKKNIAYPASFWLIVLLIPIFSLIQIIFVESIFRQTDHFLGYNLYQAYVLIGTYRIVQSLGYLFFSVKIQELKHLIRGDRNESFDNILIKPIDSQLYATLGRLNPGNISPLIVGVFITIYGLMHLNLTFDYLNLLIYITLILLGTFMVYFSGLFFYTLIFWFEDLQIAESLWIELQDLGQYPTDLYKFPLGVVLNLIVPITLMAAIPSEFLFGRQPFYMFLVYIAVILGLFLFTRWFWQISIKKYSSFSS